MDSQPRPIWQLLIIIAQSGRAESISCDECFTILEYLAEEVMRGIDIDTLRQALRRHFAFCPDCREHHLQRLGELEAMFIQENDTHIHGTE